VKQQVKQSQSEATSQASSKPEVPQVRSQKFSKVQVDVLKFEVRRTCIPSIKRENIQRKYGTLLVGVLGAAGQEGSSELQVQSRKYSKFRATSKSQSTIS
jgi:hypothetical protein